MRWSLNLVLSVVVGTEYGQYQLQLNRVIFLYWYRRVFQNLYRCTKNALLFLKLHRTGTFLFTTSNRRKLRNSFASSYTAA